jgi:hypothetical protein
MMNVLFAVLAVESNASCKKSIIAETKGASSTLHVQNVTEPTFSLSVFMPRLVKGQETSPAVQLLCFSS